MYIVKYKTQIQSADTKRQLALRPHHSFARVWGHTGSFDALPAFWDGGINERAGWLGGWVARGCRIVKSSQRARS